MAANPKVSKLINEFRSRHVFTDMGVHDRMLADSVRVDTYAAGLAKHVREGDVVVDLGTGTGILSFLALKAKPKVVHALDHSDIIEGARTVARANGITGVEFHRVNSRRFELPGKADVVIHEQIGDYLFDEAMVVNLLDLRDRVLREGGRIVPAEFDLNIDPVQLTDEGPIPLAWQQTLHGIDFGALRDRYSDHAPKLRRDLRGRRRFDRLLAAPEPVFSIDLNACEGPDLPRSLSYRRPIASDGRLDGFCVSFVARFDDDIYLNSSPFAPAERRPSSWKIPVLRVEPETVSAGDEISFTLEAEDLAEPRTWRWSYARITG